MRKLGLAVICLAAISAGVALSGGEVRWVCNPWGRCWWRPNYYVAPAYGYYGYGPRFGYYGGWHHHWHHWRRW
jgi:hypothetical protein